MQLYFADGATHTDTHTDENETQVNSKEPRSQGERRAGVAAQLGTCTLEGGVLRGAAPANGRAARPTVTCVGLVSTEEPEQSRAESQGRGQGRGQDPARDPVEVGCPRSLSESTRRIAPPTKIGHAPPPTDS